MFTKQDVNSINEKLRQDGIDFEVSLSNEGRALSIERLEFGGCEDQDGALRSVLQNYFRDNKQRVRMEKSKIYEN